MIYVGYSASFDNTFLFGEDRSDIQKPQAMSIEKKQEYIETVISTTDQHKKMRRFFNERNTSSPNVSHKINQLKQNSHSAS